MGTVTNPTGSVNGISLAGLADAYTGSFAGTTQPLQAADGQWMQAQWNYSVQLSDKPDPCSRQGSGGGYAPEEVTLTFVVIGFAPLPDPAPWQPPAADLPLTLTAQRWQPSSDGVQRKIDPIYMKARKNGGPGSTISAIGGTVTFTRIDATAHEGSYDLTFPNGGRAAGSFVAPWCGAVPA